MGWLCKDNGILPGFTDGLIGIYQADGSKEKEKMGESEVEMFPVICSCRHAMVCAKTRQQSTSFAP